MSSSTIVYFVRQGSSLYHSQVWLTVDRQQAAGILLFSTYSQQPACGSKAQTILGDLTQVLLFALQNPLLVESFPQPHHFNFIKHIRGVKSWSF